MKAAGWEEEEQEEENYNQWMEMLQESRPGKECEEKTEGETE